MICYPNAKINFGLDIISKRNDGYHNISSLLYPIPFFDVLEFLPSKTFKLDEYGIKLDISEEDNLVTRAWELMHKQYNVPPLEIKLLKQIPAGSGLGGGSADAAFLIKYLNNFFKLGLSTNRMEQLALQIGSDCPFFILNKPSLLGGRGEIIEPVNFSLKGKYLLLVLPGIHTSTKESYSRISLSRGKQPIGQITNQPIQNWVNVLTNDFEIHLFKEHSELKEIKNKLYNKGATFASLTGSGSALYGLFDRKPDINSSDFSCPFFSFML